MNQFRADKSEPIDKSLPVRKDIITKTLPTCTTNMRRTDGKKNDSFDARKSRTIRCTGNEVCWKGDLYASIQESRRNVYSLGPR